MDIKRVKDAIEAVDKEAKQLVEKELKTLFLSLFAGYSNLLAVRWEQYAPHFNDGDACIFRYRGFEVQLSGAPQEDYFVGGWRPMYELDGELYRELQELDKLFCSKPITAALRSYFGEESTVTITPESIVVSACSNHD